MILFIMKIGAPPFLKATKKDIFYKSLQKKRSRHNFWKAHNRMKPDDLVDEEFKDLIYAFFNPEVGERISLAEVRKHPWFCREVATSKEVQTFMSGLKEDVAELRAEA